MIEPLVSLAFTMHSGKGVYALLLGSGVSRAAQIPTGWEIVLNLIKKVAATQGEDSGTDPMQWYLDTYGKEPNYSNLIESLCKTRSERNQLLRNYFEPTADEREQGIKVPTTAHRTIAKLVSAAYVRVIVTTNFDRLMEQALELEGIVPTVISTPDAAEGALPLPFTTCTIIKINGDYLDARFKNTPEELSSYDPRLDLLLDRVFDEYGLIICGWSAEWDIALGQALERCPTRRFATYWALRGEPTDRAKRLMVLRQSVEVKIGDADSFFHEVEEKVSALEKLGGPHPLSPKMAAASMKKYLVDSRYRIDLHDLVMREANQLVTMTNPEHFPVGVPYSDAELSSRVDRYEAQCGVLLALFITGCYWGNVSHNDLWQKCLEYVANSSKPSSGFNVWLDLRYYPALLLLYGGGIASVAAGNYFALISLLEKTRLVGLSRDDSPIIRKVNPGNVIQTSVAQRLPGLDRRHTPLNDRVFNFLREPMREVIPRDSEYERFFDRFEALVSLVIADLSDKSGSLWGPPGRYAWKHDEKSALESWKSEVLPKKNDASLLQAGFFEASSDRFLSVYEGFISNVVSKWHFI